MGWSRLLRFPNFSCETRTASHWPLYGTNSTLDDLSSRITACGHSLKLCHTCSLDVPAVQRSKLARQPRLAERMVPGLQFEAGTALHRSGDVQCNGANIGCAFECPCYW